MKISNEQTQALQETQVTRQPTGKQDGFDALLAQQLASGKAQGTAAALDPQLLMRPGLPVSLIAGDMDTTQTSAQATVMEMASRMDGLFNGMESYARQLASENPEALREAFSLLEGMTADIASFRSAFPDMAQNQPELAAMMNEFEALAITETFKFNRGDYL